MSQGGNIFALLDVAQANFRADCHRQVSCAATVLRLDGFPRTRRALPVCVDGHSHSSFLHGLQLPERSALPSSRIQTNGIRLAFYWREAPTERAIEPGGAKVSSSELRMLEVARRVGGDSRLQLPGDALEARRRSRTGVSWEFPNTRPRNLPGRKMARLEAGGIAPRTHPGLHSCALLLRDSRALTISSWDASSRSVRLVVIHRRLHTASRHEPSWFSHLRTRCDAERSLEAP